MKTEKIIASFIDEDVKNQWDRQIDKATESITKKRLPINDNDRIINHLYPFWEEFIKKHSNINAPDLATFDHISNKESQVIFIAQKYPQYAILAFWAITVIKLLRNYKGKSQ